MKKKNLIKEIMDLQEDIGCLYTRSNEAQQEIRRAHDRHTHHVSDHRANDLLPQFTELCKKVESLEGKLNFKLNDGPIMNHSKRIADLEETAEALSETVDQSTLSSKMFLERVVEIEILKTQVSGLENRLSRAQDMIAEMHKDGFIPVETSKRKTCKNCKYGDGAYCNHDTPSHCSHYELWEQKEKKPAGRPKKGV